MYGAPVGTIYVTGSGYLTSHVNTTTGITTYEPTRVFHISLVSSGTAASVIQITNGSGGNVYINETGTAGKGSEFDFGINGKAFPAGAYVIADANLISAAIDCRSDKF